MHQKKNKKIVHVIGTGTIGEPLIVLLARIRRKLGISEITFSKKTPRIEDRPKIMNLISKGAKLCADNRNFKDFHGIGLSPKYELEEAIKRASVVIDCSPSGNENKVKYYKKYQDQVLGFLAQGSETDFGKPYAFSITDKSLSRNDKYIWIVSCNTHNIATIIWTIGLNFSQSNAANLISADFTIFRRATDISQPGSKFIPSPEVGKHDSGIYGTHQAEDAKTLFEKTFGINLNIFSSAAKANSQYMHVMRFNLELNHKVSREEVIHRIKKNPLIAITEKKSTSHVFSFGRDQGHYGRILNQTVIPINTITVVNNRVIGFCFTPQDGNSLLSSTAATLYFLYPDDYFSRMKLLQQPPFVFKEV